MARIRTIKPEFWTNPKVVSVSRDARLMYIGMWNYADDYGRLAFEPLSIKLRLFPNDADVTVDDVKNMLNELSQIDLILIYSANGKEYIEITGWDHQKIDRRQASKLPAPFADDSEIRRIPPTPADSPRLPPTPADFPRWKGREGKGMEGNGGEGNSVAYATGAEAPPDPAAIPQSLAGFPVGRRIMLAVVRHYNVSLTDIYSRRRTRSVVIPRQLIMYLARTYTTMSLMQIGNLLGGRDHTTVFHACRKIEQYRAQNPEMDLIIAKIKQDAELA